MKRLLFAVLPLLVACSGSDAPNCQDIEEDIRSRAIALGYDGDGDGVPDAKGVCNSSNKQVQRDFNQSCAELAICRAK